MIPVNFSTTRIVADYISTHRESNHFIQREIVTRIIGISLSLFSLFDLIAHSIGALERAIIKDHASATKHLKCLQLFAEAIPLASFQALYKPDPKTFACCENKRAALASALLLSGKPETLKKISASDFLDYVLSLREEMPEQEGMEETLSVLPGAKDLHKDFNRLRKQKLLIDGGLTLRLSTSIKKLLDKNPSLLNECLARLLSLGLSFSAALDFLGRLVVTSLYLLETFLLDIFILRGQLYDRDFKLMGLLFLDHLKEIFFTLPGIVGGSVAGVVDPQLALKIANPSSGLYDKFRYTHHHLLEKIKRQIQKLKEEGGKIIIPLTFHSSTSFHQVYLMVARYTARPSFALYYVEEHENKNCLYIKTLEPNFQKVSEQVTAIVNESLPSSENAKSWYYFLEKMHNPMLLEKAYLAHQDPFQKKPKASTTCPKDSLFSLLHLHTRSRDSRGKYYKIFKKNLKKRALERDGHLLDIALSIPKT